jgi:hypothetical protein
MVEGMSDAGCMIHDAGCSGAERLPRSFRSGTGSLHFSGRIGRFQSPFIGFYRLLPPFCGGGRETGFKKLINALSAFGWSVRFRPVSPGFARFSGRGVFGAGEWGRRGWGNCGVRPPYGGQGVRNSHTKFQGNRRKSGRLARVGSHLLALHRGGDLRIWTSQALRQQRRLGWARRSFASVFGARGWQRVGFVGFFWGCATGSLARRGNCE